MPAGRSVLLLRRLSTSENSLKNINVNSCGKDSQNSFCSHHRYFTSKRFSSFSHGNILKPQLRTSYSDNIIKMSASTTVQDTIEGHKYTNRLINEKSPYLLQHAHNPVDWYPWGQEAFKKAKTEKKLIFLSIGYSTCHWCHVMEKESFENENVAKILNEHYISIKVDREERPDIDNIYMLFIVATTGRGGWPLSVFLTPELRPVTGGTYFPPTDTFGKPGFKSILLNLKTRWNTQKKQFLEVGEGVVEALEKMSLLSPPEDSQVPGEDTWKRCVMYFMNMFEPEFGGFGTAPKFPQASIFNFLFHYYARDKTNLEAKQCLEICLYTLTKIAKGGIHDHVSSGIARYSVDNDWHVPHFEKMLYDQAQLAVVYTNAYLATKDEFYADVVRDIIKYVNRDLRDVSGGYYSAEDADSYPTVGAEDKKEGAFYVWEYHELKTLLKNKSINNIPYINIICDYFNVEEDGNISPESDPHEELANKNVLIIYGSKEDTAKKFGITVNDLNKVLKLSIEIMFKARQKRPRPHLDTKILCSWNGLMISGLAQAGQGLGSKLYVDDAIKAAKFIKTHLYDDKNKILYHSCYKGEDGGIVQGEKPIKGFLEDYAFLIRGLLDLYEASLDQTWLKWARELQINQNDLFWDKNDGAYFSSSNEDKSAIIRMKPEQDNAEPSGNSVSCHNLIRLGAYQDKSAAPEGGNKDREMAKTLLTLFSDRLNSKPSTLTAMMSALMFYNDSPTQVLIAGKFSDPRTMELVKVVRSRLLPGRVLAVTDPAAVDKSPAGMFDLFLSRIRPVGDQPTAYVCRRFSCSLPVTDAKQLESLLDQNPSDKPAEVK